MRKSAIWGVLFLMMSVFAANALAETTDGTPAEETICDQLKADGITKGLYGLCVAYCEAIDGPAEIVEGDDLSGLNPPNSILLAIYQNKMREGDPEMPCVNYVGACPLWSQEELDRIGTLGGSSLEDFELVFPFYENYYDLERNWNFSHYAQVIYFNGGYEGQYFSAGTGFPNVSRKMELTEAEYNSCKQMIIDHVTRN